MHYQFILDNFSWIKMDWLCYTKEKKTNSLDSPLLVLAQKQETRTQRGKTRRTDDCSKKYNFLHRTKKRLTEELETPLARKGDVLRLEIAVHHKAPLDRPTVEVTQRRRQLQRAIYRLLGRELPVLLPAPVFVGNVVVCISWARLQITIFASDTIIAAGRMGRCLSYSIERGTRRTHTQTYGWCPRAHAHC